MIVVWIWGTCICMDSLCLLSRANFQKLFLFLFPR